MNISPQNAAYIVWGGWALSWIAASLWANRTVRTPALGRELPYRVLTFSGFVLLLYVFVHKDGARIEIGRPPGFLGTHVWPTPPDAAGWVMVGFVVTGVLFAWWARIHLGRLWSARITQKQDHRVVDSGPYGIVRHPIYTGLLTAALATMVIAGDIRSVAGAALMIAGYRMKAKLEERFLREQLGAAGYDAYARRVPMLVPFL